MLTLPVDGTPIYVVYTPRKQNLSDAVQLQFKCPSRSSLAAAEMMASDASHLFQFTSPPSKQTQFVIKGNPSANTPKFLNYQVSADTWCDATLRAQAPELARRCSMGGTSHATGCSASTRARRAAANPPSCPPSAACCVSASHCANPSQHSASTFAAARTATRCASPPALPYNGSSMSLPSVALAAAAALDAAVAGRHSPSFRMRAL